MLTLTRLDKQAFDQLLAQWKPHLGDDEELLFEHCRPHLDHAQKVVCEEPQDPRYGIFGLVRSRDDDHLVYEGFTHVNYNKPASEVRLVWNTLNPRYDNDLTPEILAEFTFSYIAGAILLANSAMPSSGVRIYLHNATDRRYAQGIVVALRNGHVASESVIASLAGNWLHIAGVTGLSL